MTESKRVRARALQWMTVGFCVAVLAAAAWFWARQVQSVIELLRLAYG